MRWIVRQGHFVQAQIESHLMRGFTGADQPTEKSIFGFSCWVKLNLVRTKANVGKRIGDWHRRLEFAVPGINCDSIISDATGGDDILAAGQASSRDGLWLIEELVLRPAGDDSTSIQYQQIRAKAKCLLHVMTYKDDRSLVD
jgi:hypothetical protein